MSLVFSVASIKRGRYLPDKPKENTPIREVYDLLTEGYIIPLDLIKGLKNRGSLVSNLRNRYELNIVCVKKTIYMVHADKFYEKEIKFKNV